eukprot:scaffold100570_cov56-Attheya_sp.AAC.1
MAGPLDALTKFDQGACPKGLGTRLGPAEQEEGGGMEDSKEHGNATGSKDIGSDSQDKFPQGRSQDGMTRG